MKYDNEGLIAFLMLAGSFLIMGLELDIDRYKEFEQSQIASTDHE